METTQIEEEKPIVHHTLQHKIKARVKKFLDRANKFSRLEVVGLIAIFLLIATSLFDFNLTVKRKPWISALTGKARPGAVGGKSLSASAVQNSSGAGKASEIDPKLAEAVIPVEGVELPVTWGDLGKQMVETGVIDRKKFEDLYSQRGGLDAEMKRMLLESGNGRIKITQANSQIILNLLWALGLGNKNEILDKGEMTNPQYGGDASRFASTGGWSLAKGKVMDHYSKHSFFKLTAVQQSLVDKVSQGIYRPCCGNSTHFPDCNHGMAMLGLLELMASQGASEQDMYKAALAVNSYWFPDTYLTIAKYLKTQNQDYAATAPQVLLSAQYSSSSGYKQIMSKVTPSSSGNGGGCGV